MNRAFLIEIIKNFVQKKRQERLFELMSKEKRYPDFLRALLKDTRNFQESVLFKVPGNHQNADYIYREMVRLGAGTNCYVVSSEYEQDGAVQELRGALDRLTGSMEETMLYSWQGRVAYFEGHEGIRIILRANGA